MKHWMFSSVLLLIMSSTAFGSDAFLDEGIYYDYQKQILTSQKSTQHSFSAISTYEQKIFVNALEDLVDEGNLKAIAALDDLNPLTFDLTEQLRVALIKMRAGRARSLPSQLAMQIENVLRSGNVEMRIVYMIAAYEAQMRRGGHARLIALAQSYPEYRELNKSIRITNEDSLRDLYYQSPDLGQILNGKYAGGVKLYLFCRTNRVYPCLMLMKDSRGEPVREANGELWHHQALASSKYGFPSYTRNGNTPTGVMTMDSVMPAADQTVSFGRFRRIILNFIRPSSGEADLLSTLPESSLAEDWWKPGTVARDIGRTDLRIHGSGKKNDDPNTTFFPFVQTSGCIAQKENTYGNMTFIDQRKLLDKIMTVMNLNPVYANETKIKGLIYITEIGSENAPVTLDDLHEKGIQ